MILLFFAAFSKIKTRILSKFFLNISKKKLNWLNSGRIHIMKLIPSAEL